MKRCVILVMACSAFLFVHHRAATAGNGISPSGDFETSWVGLNSDRMVCYLTFNTNLTWTGYGIALKSFGPVTVNGTWSLDSKNRVTGGFTELRSDGDVSAFFSATVSGNGKFHAHASSPHGQLRIQGAPVATTLDLSGNWIVERHTGGNSTFETYTLTANTNQPGWFDIAGTGTGQGGSYNLTGALVVTSTRLANAFIVSDFGQLNTTSTWSYAGKFVSSGERGNFRGHDDHGHDLIIRFERP
jgi:hypothetical protein